MYFLYEIQIPRRSVYQASVFSSTDCCRLHAIERKKQKKAEDLEARSQEIRNRLEMQRIEARVKKRQARLDRSASLPVEESAMDEYE